ncbi:MAG TPA: hypothetical protein VF761_16900 [Gemmatimonadaceae bacterium]
MANPTPLRWIDQRKTERGTSFDIMRPMVYAMPLTAPIEGERARGNTVEFECGGCRAAHALVGQENKAKFAIDRHNIANSLAVAAAAAIEHVTGHNFGGTVWTTVELQPELTGTAFGAVLLRGYRAEGSTS